MTRTTTRPAPGTQVPAGPEPALDRLVRLMLVDLALGLVVAAATWLGHDAVVAHQLARTTGQSEQALSATLWSRPSVSVAVAVLYPLFIRRLRRHEPRGWRRTVVVSVLQVLGLSWYALGTGYPLWLSVLVGLQAVAAVAVLVAATRPEVRRLFGWTPPGEAVRAGHRAVVVLVVLAPLIAEVAWGSTRFSQLYGVLLYWPAYGAGALLVRELVRRRGPGRGGWAAVLLLGVAYGLVEEGLALQSLTSTTIFPDMARLTPQLGGLNIGYAVMVLTYHAVFSIAVPMAVAERLAPRPVRHTPWLGRAGLAVTAVVAVLGFGLLRLIPLTADPGYTMPWGYDVGFAAAVVALVVVALRARRPVPRPAGRVPRVPTVGFAALLATVVGLGLLIPLPGVDRAAWAPSAGWSWVAVGAAVVVLGVAALAAARWTAAAAWTSRHTVAALTGALTGHTVVGLLSLVHRPLDIGFLAAVGVVQVGLMLWLLERTPAEGRSATR